MARSGLATSNVQLETPVPADVDTVFYGTDFRELSINPYRADKRVLRRSVGRIGDAVIEWPVGRVPKREQLLATSGVERVDEANSDLELCLTAQAKYLRNLPTNWDGYGASKLSTDLIDALIAEIKGVPVDSIPSPELVPGGDGSIQAEWHLPHISIRYWVDVTGSRYLLVNDIQGNAEHEYFEFDARTALHKWAPVMAKRE